MYSEKELSKEIKQLEGLLKSKGKSHEEIVQKARELREKRDRKEKEILDVDVLFQDKEEVKKARLLLEKYSNNYSIETVSDKNILMQVIECEIIQDRLRQKLNEFHKENKSVPTGLVELIHKNQNQTLNLKEKLGILINKDQGTFDKYNTLMNKAKIWRENNQASRTLTCPHCGKMVLLRIRMKQWEAQKHPLFKDKVLGNEHLTKLYFEGKLTLDDVAKVLKTSEDYTPWLVDKWNLKG